MPARTLPADASHAATVSARTFPLNLAQTGCIAGHLQDASSAAMTISVVATLRPTVDVEAFREAVRRAYRDHDGVRVLVSQVDGEWRQWVADGPAYVLQVHDMTAADDPQREADRVVQALGRRRLPLDGASPLIEVHLVLVGRQDARWLVVGHHAMTDGYSSLLFRGRISQWYTHLVDGAPAPEPVGASVEEAWALSDHGRDETTVTRWVEHLGSLPDRVSLASREGPLSSSTTRTLALVGDADVARLSEGGGLGSWVFPTFAAGVAYTARALDLEDVVVGFVVSGRSHKMERLVCTNLARVVPMPVHVDPSATLPELARSFRAEATRLQKLGPTTAEEMRGTVPAAWRLGRVHGPILNVIPFGDEIELPGHEVHSEVLNRGPVDDLQVTIIPRPGGIEVDGVSNDYAYDADLGPRHVRRIARMIQLAGENPGTPLLDLDPSLPEELEARARLERTCGEQLVDSHGRPALLGSVGEVLSADGTPTGRRAVLHLDGTLEELGGADDVVVLGGHVVALERLRRAVREIPGVASCDASVAKRRVQVDVVTQPDADSEALGGLVRERARGVLPALVSVRVAVRAPEPV